MTLAEKSSLSVSQEEILRQEAIEVLEELAQKQNQASLLRLRLQQSFFYWSALSAFSLVILLFFGSSFLCTSPLIKNSSYCRDNSLNSILIGLMTAPLFSISFIKAVNKRSSVKKLTDDLSESEINYNQLFNAIYSSRLETIERLMPEKGTASVLPSFLKSPKLLLGDFCYNKKITKIPPRDIDLPRTSKKQEISSKYNVSTGQLETQTIPRSNSEWVPPLLSVTFDLAKETSNNLSSRETTQ